MQNDLGKGTVNIKDTLNAALKSNIKYYIVEQEEYPNSSLESLEYDAKYMELLSL